MGSVIARDRQEIASNLWTLARGNLVMGSFFYMLSPRRSIVLILRLSCKHLGYGTEGITGSLKKFGWRDLLWEIHGEGVTRARDR